MILTTAATLVGFALAVFVIARYSGNHGAAMLASTLIIVVGAAAMSGGLVAADGTVTEDYTIEERIDANSVSESEYRNTLDVSTQDGSPTGTAFDDSGSRMYMVGTGGDAVYQYDTSNWETAIATYERQFSIAEDTDPTGVTVDSNGQWMYVVGSSTASIYQYELSEAYNISTANLVEQLDVSTWVTEPQAFELAQNGSEAFLAGSADSELISLSLQEDHNISTAVLDNAFDTSSLTSTPTGLAFSKNGTRMLMSSDSELVYQFEVSTAYDLDSLEYTGFTFDTSTQVNKLEGIEYEDDGRTMIVVDTQGGTVVEYDTSELRNKTISKTETSYRDVTLAGPVSPGFLVLVLGVIMLLGSTGKASEEDME